MPAKTSKKITKNPKKATRKPPKDALLAKGGGAGPAAGVTFQGGIGALLASIGIGGRSIDERLEVGAESVAEFRLETESPVDDILIITTAPGRLFVQAKTNLSLSASKSSEMAKTVDQIVRQWRLCSEGEKSKEWDYPLEKDRDRFVIAVGPETPGTVAVQLAKSVSRRREGAKPQTTPQAQRQALSNFTALIKAAWKRVYGTPATKQNVSEILDLVVVAKFDFRGADLGLGHEFLRSSLAQPGIVRSAFKTLARECEERMERRTGFTIQEIRRVLERNGIRLLAPEDYRKDILALQKKKKLTQEGLSLSTTLNVDGGDPIPIPRAVSDVAKIAAQEGSFLIAGEPGAGKTGVLSDLAAQLESDGHEVLVLSVDKLGSRGLNEDLGLSHSLPDVLENWPGTGPAYLLIDGLDAARGGTADADYRNLIAETLALPDRRWNVIASVRSFDLRAGQQYKSLFKGAPPSPDYVVAGQDMANVRHIEVREWSESEFDDLLKKAPKLRKAIDVGGPRLRGIALVPFNTQLLAEVVALGVPDTELGSIRNQTELLRLYWHHRVAPFGSIGKACLTSTLEAMVDDRSLEADAARLEQMHANILDRLQQVGVLVPRRNGRLIAFRHNILFDYAASTLYLDPFKSNHLRELFLRDRGLGLILGPALGYALQELWDDEPNHSRFWDLVVLLVSDKNVDPIARSLIARRASEFARSVADIQQLADKLTDTRQYAGVLSSLAGAFTILLEDSPQIVDTASWSFLTERLSTGGTFAGPVGYLVENLLKTKLTAESFDLLGKAARNLLERGFAVADSESNRNFVRFSIGSVANTYASDPKASRVLLEKVFDKKRLKTFAYIEVPALAQKIATIAELDPEFAVCIYGQTFAYRVASQAQKPFSGSRIMPMSGTESDMYNSASYSLAQHFAEFFKHAPKTATEALVAVIEGHVSAHHEIPQTVTQKNLHVGETRVQLIEDGSRYWAWEINTTHPDSTQMILQQHIANLRNADAQNAETIVSVLFARNRLALLWARLLMVGAERPEIYAPLLWELATNEQVLLYPDTAKDAIDAISAFYPLRTVEERRGFEEKVFAYGVDDPVYQSVRDESLHVLFQTVGAQNLVTEQAQALSIPTPHSAPAVNARPFSIEGGAMPFGMREQLLYQGVDLEAPAHSELLALLEEINAKQRFSNLPRPRIEDIPAAVSELRKLAAATADAEKHQANRRIIQSARKVLSDGNLSVLESAQRDNRSICEEDLSTIREVAISLSHVTDSDTGASLKDDAVTQLYFLCQQPSVAKAALRRLEEMASDPKPGVRCAVALNLSTLFEHAPGKMWKLAETFTKDEKDPAVLAQLIASSFRALRNHDPKRIESMLLRIRDRFPYVATRSRRTQESPFGAQRRSNGCPLCVE